MVMRLRWLVVLALLGSATLAWLALTPSAALREGPLIVFVPPHEGILGIAARLGEADVVRSRLAFLATAVVRGVLVARQGVTARPEDEVRRMSSAELAGFARPPGPISQNIQHFGQTSDARWCWALVLVLLTVEVAARRKRIAAVGESRARPERSRGADAA